MSESRNSAITAEAATEAPALSASLEVLANFNAVVADPALLGADGPEAVRLTLRELTTTPEVTNDNYEHYLAQLKAMRLSLDPNCTASTAMTYAVMLRLAERNVRIINEAEDDRSKQTRAGL